jgi:mediator of RNA polymerase II transcription subunit 14
VVDCLDLSVAGVHALRVRLCADEIVVITIDTRTGRMNLMDTGDLAAAGRGPRFAAISEKLNENPSILADALVRLRLHVSPIFLGEECSLALRSDWAVLRLSLISQSKRQLTLGCNVSADAILCRKVRLRRCIVLYIVPLAQRSDLYIEMAKLGPSARGTLYIQLCNFPNHYLVLVITDDRFRYALITTRLLSETMYSNMIMEDIAWLDFSRIHCEEPAIPIHAIRTDSIGTKRKRDNQGNYGRDAIIGGVDPPS